MITSVILAAASVYSAYQGYESRKEAQANARSAAEEQRKAQAEQKAMNAQKAAQERRAQIREERVRRARIIQGAENTGTSGSSGLSGAVSSISSQFAGNVGYNLGQLQGANAISDYSQKAADFSFNANKASMDAQNYDSLFGLSTNIFMASGGVKDMKSIFK